MEIRIFYQLRLNKKILDIFAGLYLLFCLLKKLFPLSVINNKQNEGKEGEKLNEEIVI